MEFAWSLLASKSSGLERASFANARIFGACAHMSWMAERAAARDAASLTDPDSPSSPSRSPLVPSVPCWGPEMIVILKSSSPPRTMQTPSVPVRSVLAIVKSNPSSPKSHLLIIQLFSSMSVYSFNCAEMFICYSSISASLTQL